MRLRPSYLLALCLAAALTLGAPPAGAHAAGISVSPSRIDQAVRPGSTVGPIVLQNSSRQPVVVDIEPRTITQTAAGLAQIDSGAQADAQARGLLRASRRRVVLAPGAAARIFARVLTRPRNGIAAYAALTFTLHNARGKSAAISPSVRVSTNLLLRFPGKAHITGRASALRAEQGPAHTLLLTTSVANTGNLHAKPHGLMTITTGAGRLVARRGIVPANVLPGAAREFPITVHELLPRGDYRARVSVRFGTRHTAAGTSFRLIAPNSLPTPQLQLLPLATPRVSPNQAFGETITAANTGTAPATGALELVLRSGRGGVLRRARFTLAVPPGSSHRARVELPGLVSGTYELDATVRSPGRVVSRTKIQFSPHRQPGSFDRFRDWSSAHMGDLLLGIAALLTGLVTALLIYVARLRRVLNE